MKVQAYLFFNGCCEEALAFYTKVLGAQTTAMMRFKDMPPSPETPISPEMAEKIMHANFTVGQTQIMASDGDCSDGSEHKGYALSISAKDVAEGKKLFDALLTDGGQVSMPYQKTFWAEGFGMLKDRFGVHWMVSCEH